MESWTFPPRYDDDYLPPCRLRATGSRVRETMPPAEREQAILVRLQEVTRYAWEHAPFYRRKWDEAGFHPDHLRSLEDFEAKVPVITKKDLREAQARAPPFGDYLCVPESARSITSTARRARRAGRRRSRSAAATGTRSPTRTRASCGAWASAPATPCSSRAIFSLYLGSWGTLAGAERLRAKAFPVRRRRAGHDRARGDVARRDEAVGLLRHAVVRAAPGRGGAQRRLRSARRSA